MLYWVLIGGLAEATAGLAQNGTYFYSTPLEPRPSSCPPPFLALLRADRPKIDYMLKLESELVAFVTTKEDPKPPHLVLPPRSSYQRLIAYRLSARFKLQKATAAQEREAIIAAGMDPATTNGGELACRGGSREILVSGFVLGAIKSCLAPGVTPVLG